MHEKLFRTVFSNGKVTTISRILYYLQMLATNGVHFPTNKSRKEFQTDFTKQNENR